MAAPATIARPATGETLRGKQKEKDVRMSNIIAAKGAFCAAGRLWIRPLCSWFLYASV